MDGGVVALRELAVYCAGEAKRWCDWLAQQDAALLALPVGEAQIATVGTLLMHVAWVDRAYVDVLTGTQTEYEWLPVDSVEQVRAMQETTFARLFAWLDTATAADLARERTLRVRGLRLTACGDKMLAHTLVHGIRHYAQLATKLREQGHVQPWQHDLILEEGFGPAAAFEQDA